MFVCFVVPLCIEIVLFFQFQNKFFNVFIKINIIDQRVCYISAFFTLCMVVQGSESARNESFNVPLIGSYIIIVLFRLTVKQNDFCVQISFKMWLTPWCTHDTTKLSSIVEALIRSAFLIKWKFVLFFVLQEFASGCRFLFGLLFGHETTVNANHIGRHDWRRRSHHTEHTVRNSILAVVFSQSDLLCDNLWQMIKHRNYEYLFTF